MDEAHVGPPLDHGCAPPGAPPRGQVRWLTERVDDSDGSPSPDAFEVVVDGVRFSVIHDEDQPGAYHYERRTPPASGYGFTSRRSDHQRSTMVHHLDAIRDFLSVCDPATGYIEEDLDDSDDEDG